MKCVHCRQVTDIDGDIQHTFGCAGIEEDTELFGYAYELPEIS